MLLNEKGEKVEDFKKEDSEISNEIKNGLTFKREEVGGKIRYSYSIYLTGNPTDEGILKAISYAKEQLESVIIGKKVEDKVTYFKAKELEQ